MRELLSRGILIDVALAAILIEVAILMVSRARQRRGLAPLDLFGQLLAGALLLLAVRTAVTGADYRWTLVLISASFPAHLFDLMRRARAAAPSP
jgi:hypothetical protein